MSAPTPVRSRLPSRTHESLMGSMMARSTPRVLFHSRLIRYSATALEILSAMHAIALLITLCFLHIRFVRREGCAPLLYHSLSSKPPPFSPLSSSILPQSHLPSVIQITVTSYRDPVIFRYSPERGLLLLSDSTLSLLNVSVTRVTLNSNHSCLGDPIARFILRHLVGYDTVAVNAFAKMRRRVQSHHGYVLSVNSRRLLNLLHADPGISTTEVRAFTRLAVRLMWKCGAIITAVFIMFTTGALVAFTLKQVQVRMIKLTIDLQVVMRSQMGYGRVILRYALDALIFVPIIAGMLFFLFEFFDDQALAFAVLIITWLCEFAASGSTRHWISRYYLPRLFLCYFGAFHVYFFSFPLGFSWLAFATSLVFMVHAALTVWNHCELPLLRNELLLEPDSR